MKVFVDEDLQEFIPKYLKNKNEDIERLKELIETKNFQEIRKIGHNFQGTGTSYGFEFVSDCGLRLRQFAKQENTQKLDDVRKKLIDYFKDIEIEYITIEDDF